MTVVQGTPLLEDEPLGSSEACVRTLLLAAAKALFRPGSHPEEEATPVEYLITMRSKHKLRNYRPTAGRSNTCVGKKHLAPRVQDE